MVSQYFCPVYVSVRLGLGLGRSTIIGLGLEFGFKQVLLWVFGGLVVVLVWALGALLLVWFCLLEVS